jgi:AcrR family transcriptional regulator
MTGGGEQTRQRIRREGVALLSADGLSGVSLGALAERAQMSKSGLFAHYRSKDELQIDLLFASTELARNVVVGPAMQAPVGLPRLVALFGLWCGWSRRAGLPGGCPIAAALFELDDLSGPVRETVVDLEARWRGVLATFVRGAMAEGHLPMGLDVDQVVWELTGIYLAHHAAMRLVRAPDADDRARAAFSRLMAWAAGATKSAG